jgi:thiaminase
MIGERLKAEQANYPPKGENSYQTWIDNYTNEEYRATMDKGRGRLILE